MAVTMITRSVSPLYSQLWLALRARVHGPWSLPCLASCSHHAKKSLQVFPVQASCRLERNGRVPAVRNGVVSQSYQRVSLEHRLLSCWVAGLLVVVALVLMRINVRSVLALSFCISSLISSHISDFISSFSSRCFFFLCLLCLSSFFLFFFFLSLLLSLSLPVSLHLFLSCPVLDMDATILSHFVFVMKMCGKQARPLDVHKRFLF